MSNIAFIALIFAHPNTKPAIQHTQHTLLYAANFSVHSSLWHGRRICILEFMCTITILLYWADAQFTCIAGEKWPLKWEKKRDPVNVGGLNFKMAMQFVYLLQSAHYLISICIKQITYCRNIDVFMCILSVCLCMLQFLSITQHIGWQPTAFVIR